jgi:hypothetical protein
VKEIYGEKILSKVMANNVIAACGWNVVGNELKCICCLRTLSLNILLKTQDSPDSKDKIEFDPLAFHFDFCYFS